MIKSITGREAETIFTRQRSRTLPQHIRQVALRQKYRFYDDRNPYDHLVSLDDLHTTRVETER